MPCARRSATAAKSRRLIRTIRPQGIPFRRRGHGKRQVGRRCRHALRTQPNQDCETASPAAGLPDKPSIAVLPFQNMSGDPEQEYFADGMVEDIITALSRMRWLFVIARNSSFTYKGRAVDVKQVGRELGRALRARRQRAQGGEPRAHHGTAHRCLDRRASLGGPLRRRARRHLRSAGSGDRERRGRDRAEAGAGRNRACQAQADREPRRLRLLSARNGELLSADQGGHQRGAALFYKAIELDPNFASAYGMAAWCYAWRKINGWMTDRAQEIAETARLARRAAELGKDDAVALSRGGHALGFVVGDLDAAVTFIDRALVLNPNLAGAWYASGWMRALAR